MVMVPEAILEKLEPMQMQTCPMYLLVAEFVQVD